MSKLRGLVLVAIEKTQEDKIAWDSLSSDEFYAEIGVRTVFVSRRKSNSPSINGQYLFFVRLADESGTVIESYRETSKSGENNEKLFEIARRKALRIDENLAAFETELRSL